MNDGRGAGTPVTITLDGETFTGIAGQTLAGVLIGARHLSWRTSSVSGRPRGVFCGIGVCFDCLLTIDGTGGQRACLVPARPGMTVTTREDDDA